MEIIETNLSFGALNYRTNTSRIIVHHSASTVSGPEDIHRWHLGRGWSGAGYHFLVRKDGNIYRLRPENAVGAHAYGSNHNSIGICFEGNFEIENMTDEQVNSGAELVQYLKEKYGINTVQRHKDVNATACPGKNFQFDKIANGKIEIQEKKETNNNNKALEWQKLMNSTYNCRLVEDNIFGNDCKFKANKYLLYYKIPHFKNAVVGFIQRELIGKGFPCGRYGIDNNFGKDTSQAVKNFQASVDISVDGKVGKNTIYYLLK